MNLKKYIKEKNMSIYKVAKMSGISYATLNEIVNDKRNIVHCSAETVYRLAKALDLSMEDLLEDKIFITPERIQVHSKEYDVEGILLIKSYKNQELSFVYNGEQVKLHLSGAWTTKSQPFAEEVAEMYMDDYIEDHLPVFTQPVKESYDMRFQRRE